MARSHVRSRGLKRVRARSPPPTQPLAEAAAAGGGDALEAAVRRAVPDQRADAVLWRLSASPLDGEVLSAAQQRMTELILPKAFAAVTAMERTVEEVLLELLRRPCKEALQEVHQLLPYLAVNLQPGTWLMPLHTY